MNCLDSQRHLLQKNASERAVADHLRQCPGCREFQRVLAATLAPNRAAPQPTAVLDEAVRAAARRRPASRHSPLPRLNVTRWLPAAIAASLLLVALMQWKRVTSPKKANSAPVAIVLVTPVEHADSATEQLFATGNVDNALLDAEISFSLYTAIVSVE